MCDMCIYIYTNYVCARVYVINILLYCYIVILLYCYIGQHTLHVQNK